MNEKKQQKRRGSRPSITQANAALLFAAIGSACLAILRICLPREYSSLEAGVLWDAAQIGLWIASAAYLSGAVRPQVRERRMRLQAPTIAQVVLALLVVGAGILFTDDLTLLTGAVLQRIGLDVSRHIAACERAPGYLYTLRVLLSGVLPAAASGWFFHGALLCAWERRGTRYAMAVSSVLCALMGGSIVMLPMRLALGFAAGMVLIKTGSLPLGMFVQMGVSVAGIAARQVQSAIGMEAARFGRLWREIGGKQGAAFLALETLLLGLVFAFLVHAVCCAKPKQPAPWRARAGKQRTMSAANVFVLASAVTTALAVLLMDFLQMAGIF